VRSDCRHFRLAATVDTELGRTVVGTGRSLNRTVDAQSKVAAIAVALASISEELVDAADLAEPRSDE
jgi:hypothetical protein